MNEENKRKLSYARGLNSKSDGCFTFKQGLSAVIAGVNAPRDCPKHQRNPNQEFPQLLRKQ